MTDDLQKLMGARPDPAVPVKVARVFTTLRTEDGKRGQFFDVPLGPSAAMPHLTPWAAFMTNLLTHRGMLTENAWIPERVIDFIAVNPETGGLDPEKFEPGKIVPLRPIA